MARHRRVETRRRMDKETRDALTMALLAVGVLLIVLGALGYLVDMRKQQDSERNGNLPTLPGCSCLEYR